MRARLLIVAVGLTVLAAVALADEPAKKEKEAVVGKIDLAGLRRDIPNNRFGKPVAIGSEEELAKAFPEEAIQARLKKDVDLKKWKLVFFVWSGSGGDKLDYTVEEGKKSMEVVFRYQPGLTRDLRGHFHLFAVRNDLTWRMADK